MATFTFEEQRVIIRFLHLRGKKPIENHQQLSETCNYGIMDVKNMRLWVRQYRRPNVVWSNPSILSYIRQDRWIQTELVFTLAKNATKPNPFNIISLLTTRKENNWKTEETLARTVVTGDGTDQTVQSLMFMMMTMIIRQDNLTPVSSWSVSITIDLRMLPYRSNRPLKVLAIEIL